jgi:succinoglycan biosynthesis protein ExoM
VRVAVGVCTAYRPGMLAACLAALRQQEIPQGCELSVIVADNEPEPRNRSIVEDAAAASGDIKFRHIHEPRRGISRARNAILDACGDRFDWIAFTDDDCIPASDWIACLLAAAKRHGADVVYGRREWIAPEPAPFWYFQQKAKHTEGQELAIAATCNVLISGGLVGPQFKARPSGLRFDVELAHGEDGDFFYRAKFLGARIVYSAAPLVREVVPANRATLRYHASRSFYHSANRTYLHRRHRGFDLALAKILVRPLWKMPIAIGRLIAAPVVGLFSTSFFKRSVLDAVGRLVATVGAVAGAAGYHGNPYRKVGRRKDAHPRGGAASALPLAMKSA